METKSGGHDLRRAWAAALMPGVLHELNNATQFISMLHSVNQQDPESGLLERAAEDLGATASSVEDLGLLMAILSTAAGTDLLMERRSGRGVAVAVELTSKLIRKSGRDLRWSSEPPEDTSEQAAQGWELPWAVACSLWLGALALEEGECLDIAITPGGWGAAKGGSSQMAEHADAVAELLPAISAEVSGESWWFGTPDGWLAERAS